MSFLSPSSALWSSRLPSVLRIVAAFLFITHGTQKYFGVPTDRPRQPVPVMSLAGLAGAIELTGGPLMLVGLFVQPVAFILSGEMAVAYFRGHAPRNFWPQLNGGEHTVLFCFIFLYMWAAGGGAWSLDALRKKGRTEGSG